jgi:hypothetical protein
MAMSLWYYIKSMFKTLIYNFTHPYRQGYRVFIGSPDPILTAYKEGILLLSICVLPVLSAWFFLITYPLTFVLVMKWQGALPEFLGLCEKLPRLAQDYFGLHSLGWQKWFSGFETIVEGFCVFFGRHFLDFEHRFEWFKSFLGDPFCQYFVYEDGFIFIPNSEVYTSFKQELLD